MTERVPNWPLVLAAKVAEWRARPFEYGVSDCWQFAGDVVLALTRVDHRHKFPTYSSIEEADEILGESGMVAIGNACLGRPKPALQAMRGDIVLADFGAGPAASVCDGVICWAPGPRGLVHRLTASGRIAWSV